MYTILKKKKTLSVHIPTNVHAGLEGNQTVDYTIMSTGRASLFCCHSDTLTRVKTRAQWKCITVTTMVQCRIQESLVLSPTCFTTFCLNVPCQYTSLLNLRLLIFGLTPFGWLRFITLTTSYSIIYYGNMFSDLRPFDLHHLF